MADSDISFSCCGDRDQKTLVVSAAARGISARKGHQAQLSGPQLRK
ncbi:hypothetical protein [Aerosakkonema funiforme]